MDACCLDKATGVFYTPQYLDVKESFCSKKLVELNKSVNFDAKMKNMEKIKIYYGVQGDGMTFNLMPSAVRTLKALFPDAQPPKSIFVVYDWRVDFANYHANLEKYIFPALMGLKNDDDLKQFKTIEFIKTPEEQVTYTIEQNHQDEQEIQLISRQSGTVLDYV